MWKVRLIASALIIFVIGTMMFLVLSPGEGIYENYMNLNKNGGADGFQSKKEFTSQKEVEITMPGDTFNNGSNMSKETADILAMDDAEFWYYLTDGRITSHVAAGEAYRQNASEEKAYWEDSVGMVEVPIWKWKDGTHAEKISSTMNIKVNEKMFVFFTDYFTDLYNLPEKYVIVSVGGFDIRGKNDGTGAFKLSAHSYGTTVDINAFEDGMGSVAAGDKTQGKPFNSSVGLKEPQLSQTCTYDNSWFKLAEEYQFNWGGLWSDRYTDPMHFSLIGDSGKLKGTVDYTPKTQGRNTIDTKD